MASKRKSIVKKDEPRSKAQMQADLGKLGKYLSAEDVKNPSRAKVARQRQNDLVDKARSARGGGQGKAAPQPKPKSQSDKHSPKMDEKQRRESFIKYNPKPSLPYSGTWNVSARKKPGK